MEIRIGYSDQSPRQILIALGYIHRPNADDFIKPDANGRFHAKVKCFERQIAIHYDLDVDGNHVAGIPMPIHMQKELSRVQSFADKQRIKNTK